MSRKPVEIGRMSFSSKKDAKEYRKKIFSEAKQAIRKGQKAILSGDQARFMIALIATDSKFHARVNDREIDGCEIKYTKVNTEWCDRQIAAHLLFNDGSEVHFRTNDLISKL